MKRIILATALAALFSANLMAATEITSHRADQRQSVGFVTLNQNVVSPDDASSRQQNRRSTRRKLLSHHRPARTGRQQHDARQRRAVPLKAHATPEIPVASSESPFSPYRSAARWAPASLIRV